MLTLRTLKELIDTPKRGEKLPTPKQLRTGESPVVAHKTTGAGVNLLHRRQEITHRSISGSCLQELEWQELEVL